MKIVIYIAYLYRLIQYDLLFCSFFLLTLAQQTNHKAKPEELIEVTCNK